MARTTIIAEAGVNHNGDLSNAFKLIDAAKEAGADYIKFQTFKANELVAKSAKKAEYQKLHTQNDNQSQLDMLKKLELSQRDHEQLIRYCLQSEISFFSTAFDLGSLQYLKDIGIDIVKIPSGEITNLPYLRKAATLFNRVILSTGMCTLNEISAAINVFLDHRINKKEITILHCNTEYPTPFQDVNLKAMLQIQNTFGTPVGYSDHTLGIEVPIAAVALGASIIEKHFTLDKKMSGPDHAASLEPAELKAMVSAIRKTEQAISGSGIKEPSTSERKNLEIVRKSIVAYRKIFKGEIFSDDNLTIKRPGNGISPMRWDEVLGTKAKKNFEKDDLISL